MLHIAARKKCPAAGSRKTLGRLPRIKPTIWHLNEGRLGAEAGPTVEMVLAPAHQSLGTAAGHWCPGGDGGEGELPVELPLDQQQDDARSLVFDSPPLSERVEILGSPVIELDVAVDKPVALLSVRLNELQPGGTSRKVTYGVLNLTHRDGHANPQPLDPGKRYRIRIELKHAGFAFKRDHRIRVSISTAYWPLVWPSPEPVTLSLRTGSSTLNLPVRPPRAADASLRPFGPAFLPPNSGMTQIKPATKPTKAFGWDVGSSTLTITSTYDGGIARFDAIGTEVTTRWQEISRIHDADPTSAHLTYWQRHEFLRPDWHVRIETTITVSCSKDKYLLKGDVRTYDGEKPFFTNSWTREVSRHLS